MSENKTESLHDALVTLGELAHEFFIRAMFGERHQPDQALRDAFARVHDLSDMTSEEIAEAALAAWLEYRNDE